ncbi:MAG: FHA domain-containing protein [Bacteroidota bacterium]
MDKTLQLAVTETGRGQKLGPYRFDSGRVTIGRSEACDLILPDAARVVSKQHAEIWLQDGTYYVKDLHSQNHTYLNAQRIPAELPCALSDGDTLRFGLYEVTVYLEATLSSPEAPLEPEPMQGARPALDASHTPSLTDNPLDQPAQAFAQAFAALRLRYEETAGPDAVGGEAALRDALRRAFSTAPGLHPPLADLLLGRAPAPPVSPASVRPVPPAPSDAPPHEIEQLLELVLPVLGRLAAIPLRFKHEFIGQTIVHSREMEVLFGGDPQRVRAHLFDPAASPEDLQRRQARMRSALEDVLLHAVAMIDGYRAAAQHGMTRLLDHVDPAAVEEEVAAGGLAFFNKGKVLDEVVKRCADLRAEDWSTVERRTFRPAFIRAYDARMRSQAPTAPSNERPSRPTPSY